MKTENRTWNYAVWAKAGEPADAEGWAIGPDRKRIKVTATGNVPVYETVEEAIAALTAGNVLGYINREHGITVRGEHTPEQCKKPGSNGEKKAEAKKNAVISGAVYELAQRITNVTLREALVAEMNLATTGEEASAVTLKIADALLAQGRAGK